MSVRDNLIRQEDTIVLSLIERAKYPRNSNAYSTSYLSEMGVAAESPSLISLFVKESEALNAKIGMYANQEEVPFFPYDLPKSIIRFSQSHPHLPFLNPVASASANVSKLIWKMYLEQVLPLLTKEADDGNYASTLACDLLCLQALSRRIHYGKFVAEVKFRAAPDDYSYHIRTKNRDALMELLTFEKVEEEVKARVEKKGRLFGQNISLHDGEEDDYKVDPCLFSHLYGEWVMPYTKLVQVDYLLQRLPK